MKIAITGANSSVGLNLLKTLVRDTAFDVKAAVRSEQAISSLPTSARIEPCIISYSDTANLAKCLANADVVVHLAGILLESAYSNYRNANIDATQAAVDTAKSNGVKHFILVSVIGADADSPNRYLASKGLAEAAVNDSGLAASIIRTPMLIGGYTAGTQALVNTANKRKANLLAGGSYSVRPLDIDDLSKAVIHCIENTDGSIDGKMEKCALHELAGPESISYRELVELVATEMGNKVKIVSVPLWLAKLAASIASLLSVSGISPTVIDVITTDEVIDANADTALGLTLTPLKTTVTKILAQREVYD